MKQDEGSECFQARVMQKQVGFDSTGLCSKSVGEEVILALTDAATALLTIELGISLGVINTFII